MTERRARALSRIVLVVALAVVAVVVLVVRAQARPLFGFNDSIDAWHHGAAAARSLGANAARFPVPWNTPPAAIGDDVAFLRSHGLRPILSLWGCETPIDLDLYADQVRAITAAYPSAVIQIWNEPNHEDFGDYGAAEAAELVRVGVRAARSVRPRGRRIIGPGLAPEATDGRPSARYKRYLKIVYRAIPDRLRIGVALNIFPYSAEPLDTLERFYRLGARHGPVWVTELGFFANTYGADQPRISARGYRRLSRWGARAVIIHRLKEEPSGERLARGTCAPPDDGPSEWETAASMAVLDNPSLAQALADARDRDRGGGKGGRGGQRRGLAPDQP